MRMTPVSEMKRYSLIPDLAVVRSQSDSSYESLAAVMNDKRNRRASDWATSALKTEKKFVLRPLQTNGTDSKEFNNLLHRRLSKIQPSCQPSEKSTGVCRSYSVKHVKKSADARQRNRGSSIPCENVHSGGVKVKERTVSNRSLPLPGDESEYFRLRNFSVTSKGIINRGDSFRSKSSSNVPSLSNLEKGKELEETKTQVPSSPTPAETKCTEKLRNFKVLLIGSSGVGKTSMRKQFMTSEYICESDSHSDFDIDQVISVNLNNEESLMEFEEETWLEHNVYSTKPDCPLPDAFVIVYSVTDRKSFSQARSILSQVEYFVESKAVILVGNKTDLARLRVVSTDEGRSLAKDRGCKFIETSVAINHQVDELLVGTLTQIRMKLKVAEKLRKKRESQGSNRRSSIYNGSKASGVLKKILRRACIKSKSCDNLHVL